MLEATLDAYERVPAQAIATAAEKTQVVAVGSSSTPCTNAFGANTKLIRVVGNVDSFIDMGTNPVATTSSVFLPANTPEYFVVAPGEKLAVLQSSVAGSLFVSEPR